MREKQTLDADLIRQYHFQDFSLREIQSELVTWRIRLGCFGSLLLYFLNLIIEPSSKTLIKFVHVDQNFYNITLEIVIFLTFIGYLFSLKKVRYYIKRQKELCKEIL